MDGASHPVPVDQFPYRCDRAWVLPYFDAGFVGVIVTMLCSIAILKIFKVHMPPTLTVGILPFVMRAPNYEYPISILMGTIALMSYFWAYSRLRESAWLRRFHYKN